MTNSRRRRRGFAMRLFAIVALVAVGVAAWWLIQDSRAKSDADTGGSGSPIRELDGATEESSSASALHANEPPTRVPESFLTPEPAVIAKDDGLKAPAVPDDTTTAVESASGESDDIGAPSESVASAASIDLARALALLTSDPIAARRQLTRVLEGNALSPAERLRGYEAINEVNQPLFFRSGIVQGDTVFVTHRIEAGETPVAIIRALNADCESGLLLRVNEIADARRIRVGQVLKVPQGAFHAEVRKGEYRLNLFHGEGAERVMVASFPVGLGEFNTTPTGIFKVRPRSKLKNPQWRNPRTGEFFAADDAKNPIGERWIGLEGIEPHNKDFAGYGIHGTIEPDSIGQMRSMGCIRMRSADVEVVYDMLTAPNSTIVIAP